VLPPGPRRPAALQVWAWISKPLPFLEDCAHRFGKRFTIKLGGGRKFVLTWDKDDVRTVFTGSPEVFSGKGNDSFRHFVGDHSLFVLDGDAHARHRRLVAPPFKGERMRTYASLTSDLTRRAIERWPKGKPISMVEAMNEITIEVIFRAIFGVEDAQRVASMWALVKKLGGTTTAALAFAPALQRDLGSWSPWGRFLRTRAALDELVFDEIKRARQATTAREDILSSLAKSELTDQELRDELLTLLGAGHETTTAGLAWALRWILGTPDAHERVVADLKAGETKILDAAIQESMRISPPIPIVPRRLATEATLGPHTLPAGTYVAPCPYLSQRDPESFPDPDRFLLDRFVGKRPGPYEFYPFGGGTRLCIGLPFAIFEMREVLATLFTHARMTLVGEASRRARRRAIILVPHDGTRVVVERTT